MIGAPSSNAASEELLRLLQARGSQASQEIQAARGASNEQLPPALTDAAPEVAKATSVAVQHAASDPVAVAKWLAAKAITDKEAAADGPATAAEEAAAVAAAAKATIAAVPGGLPKSASLAAPIVTGALPKSGGCPPAQPEGGASEARGGAEEAQEDPPPLQMTDTDAVSAAINNAKVALIRKRGGLSGLSGDAATGLLSGSIDQQAWTLTMQGQLAMAAGGDEGQHLKQLLQEQISNAQTRIERLEFSEVVGKQMESFIFAAQKQQPAQGEQRDCIVCVRPVPAEWGSSELTERFGWYGDLEEAIIERRVCIQDPKQPESDDNAAMWSLGVLTFIKEETAREVIKREAGGIDSRGTVWAGYPRKPIGWTSGLLRRYLPDEGVGLVSCEGVLGYVHLEVPADQREAFNKAAAAAEPDRLRVEVKAESGCDGFHQARQVRFKEEQHRQQQEGEPRSGGAPRGDSGSASPRKGRRRRARSRRRVKKREASGSPRRRRGQKKTKSQRRGKSGGSSS